MATTMQTVTTEDIEYVRHGDAGLMLTFYKPAGEGPFPLVLDIHGGAWNMGDRQGCAARDTFLAERGLAAAALDFRQGPDRYPSSLADINYAVRWLKAHGAELGIDPARVGITGVSSGGHLAMLAAMRPEDPRYAAVPLDAPGVDARLRCVVMLSAVINPLSRYRRAVLALQAGNAPEWMNGIPGRHETYWETEAAMAEGNPMLMLERGETVEMPPALWIQRRPDENHIYRDPDTDTGLDEPDRFVRNYRNAGGEIEILYQDGVEQSSPKQFPPLADFLAAKLSS